MEQAVSCHPRGQHLAPGQQLTRALYRRASLTRSGIVTPRWEKGGNHGTQEAGSGRGSGLRAAARAGLPHPRRLAVRNTHDAQTLGDVGRGLDLHGSVRLVYTRNNEDKPLPGQGIRYGVLMTLLAVGTAALIPVVRRPLPDTPAAEGEVRSRCAT